MLNYIDGLLRTCSLSYKEQENILEAYLKADEVEKDYITYYLGLNQIDKVREGCATQKEITRRIRLICGL